MTKNAFASIYRILNNYNFEKDNHLNEEAFNVGLECVSILLLHIVIIAIKVAQHIIIIIFIIIIVVIYWNTQIDFMGGRRRNRERLNDFFSNLKIIFIHLKKGLATH